MPRALRRYRREVLVAWWRNRLRRGYGSYSVPSTAWVERYARVHARTGRLCSCVLCSGFRGPSRQEALAALAMREQIAEVFVGSLW